MLFCPLNISNGGDESRVQELCESWGARRGLPVLMSLMVSVDVKQHWTMHTHWSQFVPNMYVNRHPRTLSSTSSSPSSWELSLYVLVKPEAPVAWFIMTSLGFPLCGLQDTLTYSLISDVNGRSGLSYFYIQQQTGRIYIWRSLTLAPDNSYTVSSLHVSVFLSLFSFLSSFAFFVVVVFL